MGKTNVTKRVTATILSMSLLTVMAGAAIAPALGISVGLIMPLSTGLLAYGCQQYSTRSQCQGE